MQTLEIVQKSPQNMLFFGDNYWYHQIKLNFCFDCDSRHETASNEIFVEFLKCISRDVDRNRFMVITYHPWEVITWKFFFFFVTVPHTNPVNDELGRSVWTIIQMNQFSRKWAPFSNTDNHYHLRELWLLTMIARESTEFWSRKCFVVIDNFTW